MVTVLVAGIETVGVGTLIRVLVLRGETIIRIEEINTTAKAAGKR
jgi:hypothetical protein